MEENPDEIIFFFFFFLEIHHLQCLSYLIFLSPSLMPLFYIVSNLFVVHCNCNQDLTAFELTWKR